MSIPLHRHRDKSDRIDLLVAVNPVWEIAWVVDALPTDRFDRSTATSHMEDGGGSALNTACALAMAGRRVVAVGRVGDDTEGRKAIEALLRRGIEPRIEIVRGRATKRNDLFVEQSTHATAFQAHLPENGVEPWQEAVAELETAAVLLLDRLTDATPDWLRLRRSRPDSKNVLNMNAPVSTTKVARRLEPVLPLLDILQIPERIDAAGAGGAVETADQRRRIHRPARRPRLTDEEVTGILDAGVGLLIRTRGERGVLLRRARGPSLEVPARPTEVRDPTGAGDAFTAGFLDATLAGGTLTEAAEHGTDWAARAVRHVGARDWLDREPPEPFATKGQWR
jgi:sugar/nucleoside kinase (ribokinase family)